MNTLNLDYYKGGGYFFFGHIRPDEDLFLPRTCKELICNDTINHESPIYFFAQASVPHIRLSLLILADPFLLSLFLLPLYLCILQSLNPNEYGFFRCEAIDGFVD